MKWTVRNERGVALILTLLITLAVAALALGGVLMASSGTLTSKFAAKEVALQSLADAGLEIARDSINRALTILPDTGYITIAPAATIKDASGTTISGYTRTVYAGKTGGRTGGPATSGQYGSNYMSVVSVISDTRGAVAARRGLFVQESWSRFAVAINNWSGSAVYGCGESVSGPFHSNNDLKLQSGCSSPKVTFRGPATVVNSVSNQSSGDFKAGLTTGAQPITWPTAAQLATMRQYAQDADAANGDYDITSPTNTSVSWAPNAPCVRLDFQPLDVNKNGTIEWDEGFVRVFKCLGTTPTDTALRYVTARNWDYSPGSSPDDPNLISPNCGSGNPFVSADSIYKATSGSATNKQTAARNQLKANPRRCYLGGDPHLFRSITGDTLLPDSSHINRTAQLNSRRLGMWVKRRSGAHSSVTAVRNTIASGGDAEYWIPLGKNPNFKGVIYVTGNVAISGRLRGRVSVVATGNIVFADDFLYTNTPGTDCSETGDIFGAIASGDVVIESNTLNAPFRVAGDFYGLYDDTPDGVNINAFFMTLGNWYGEIPSPGSPSATYGGIPNPSMPNISGQSCGGAAAGCVRVTGGMSLGRVDYATYWPIGNSNSSGWAEAHSYDICGASNPPPYFPTTGRYFDSRYYELDPVWLNQIGVATYFHELQSR
jgi:hypothetical protein